MDMFEYALQIMPLVNIRLVLYAERNLVIAPAICFEST